MDIVEFSRMRLRLLAAFLVVFASYTCFGQMSASVRGRATDSMGQPLANAVVRLVSNPALQTNNHNLRYTLVGDSLGKFSQGGIAPGAYLVMLFTDGKETDVMRSIWLKDGDDLELDLGAGTRFPMPVDTTRMGAALTDERSVRSMQTR